MDVEQQSIVRCSQVVPGRFLSPAGEPVRDLPAFAQDSETLQALYRGMVLTRTFDEKAVALQRTGRLGTFASSLGQEAVSVGLASAMHPKDVFLPSFREQGAMLWRGVTMVELLTYWGGDERGSDVQTPREDFPICVPVGTQFPHAVGVALAMHLRKEPRVAVVVGGDGATSKGDFYEALNFAGVWRLPAVFVINNNRWAISVPQAAQTAAVSLAHKAVAAGIAGEQVDGNDVIAVLEATGRAVARARSGDGPTLLEAVTYRLSDHTTADDARRYRSDDDVSAHWQEEPVGRLRTRLAAAHGWTKELEIELIERCRAEVDAAADAYLAAEPAAPAAMFEHLYAALPAALASQRASLLADGGADDG